MCKNCIFSKSQSGFISTDRAIHPFLNFGYERKGDSLILYFHSAYEGHKMEILKENPSVYVQMELRGWIYHWKPWKPVCVLLEVWQRDGCRRGWVSGTPGGKSPCAELYDPASRQDRGLFSIPCRKIKAYLRLPCLHWCPNKKTPWMIFLIGQDS